MICRSSSTVLLPAGGVSPFRKGRPAASMSMATAKGSAERTRSILVCRVFTSQGLMVGTPWPPQAEMAFTAPSTTAGLVPSPVKAAMPAWAQEDKRLTDKLTALAGETPAIRLAADRCTQEIAKAQAADRLAHSERTFCLDGWVPCEDVGKLETLLEHYCCAWELEDPSPEMYSLPAYDGVDPNPLMAPFFILFYGIMMADMGYGLLMILASIIITKKSRPKGTSGQMFGLMFSCGISTFIMGALTGGFFGDFLPQLVGIINPDTTFKALPALFTPLDDTITILIGAMALGFVQIVTGMAISFVEKIKKGQIMDAVWE